MKTLIVLVCLAVTVPAWGEEARFFGKEIPAGEYVPEEVIQCWEGNGNSPEAIKRCRGLWEEIRRQESLKSKKPCYWETIYIRIDFPGPAGIGTTKSLIDAGWDAGWEPFWVETNPVNSLPTEKMIWLKRRICPQ